MDRDTKADLIRRMRAIGTKEIASRTDDELWEAADKIPVSVQSYVVAMESVWAAFGDMHKTLVDEIVRLQRQIDELKARN